MMDTPNLIINVTAIFSGLFLYMWLIRTKWGKKHEDFQYGIMLLAVLLAALIGGFLRWLILIR